MTTLWIDEAGVYMKTTDDPPEVTTVHANPSYRGKLYGVELEIEADGLYCVEEHFNSNTEEYKQTEPDVPQGWLREQEDSIVGVELISDRPYTFGEQTVNIERVFLDIERQGFRPTRTPRGSTHVHANVADLTWDQMRHFVTACAWAEPALIELAGKGRKGNLFAQSYETTPVGWANVIEWCRRREMGQIVDTHYMATSFHPMAYLGSVEFRMGPSSRSAEEAIRWLLCIDLVVDAGRTLPINGHDEPEFLHKLISKMDERKAQRVRDKGRLFASEVWWGVNEHYEKPKLTMGKVRKGLVEGAEMNLQSAWQQTYQALSVPQPIQLPTYALNASDFTSLYPSTEPVLDSTPTPTIPEGYDLCDDPSCIICNSIQSDLNSIPN